VPESAPSTSPATGEKFNPSVPDLSGIQQESQASSESNENLATVTDISEFRESEGRRRGRPPAPEPAKMDITRRRDEGESAFDKVTDRRASAMAEQQADTAGMASQEDGSDIGDIVKVDTKGRGHRPDGKFLSEHEMDMIEANADLIRNNTPTPPESPDEDNTNPAIPPTPPENPGPPELPNPDETPPEAPEETNPDEPAPDEANPPAPPEGPNPDQPSPPEEPAPEQPQAPEEGGPGGPEGPRGPEQAYADAAHRLDDASERYARARVNSERIFGGKNDEALQEATLELQQSYHEMCGAIAQLAAEQAAQIEARRAPITREQAIIEANLAAVMDRLEQAGPEDDVERLMSNRRAYEQRQAELAQQEAAIDAELATNEANTQAAIAQQLSQIQRNVDAEMIAERERTNPLLGKFADWLRRHPKTRIVTGLALVGAGFLGAISGNVPLVVGAMAARAALSGIGGYNASRGVGEMIGNRRFDRADTSTIEGYTQAANRQSRTVRRSKKTGAVVGAAAASIPIIKGISQLNDMVKPPVPEAPTKPPIPETPIPAPPGRAEFPITDTNYPWTHMTDKLGFNGTPRILEIANDAPNHGWQVIGNGQGGGSGAILRIIAPDGYVYEGNGPINAALDHLDNLTPR